jgi:chemotaxis protein methyltransferase CheR
VSASTSALDLAADVLQRRIGLRVESTLYVRLARAIAEAAHAVGEDPEAFVAALGDDSEALQRLCDRVTVQESGFFRHPEHFELLSRELLPTITGPVRIWSAGCGNGQEAYSLAMVLAEHHLDGRVTASDVSEAAIRRTQEGRYVQRELGGLSPWRQRAHGSIGGDGWTVSPSLRSRVEARVHNLLDPLPPEVGLCQVVFCRNVLIYFTPDHAASFVNRLADTLPPGAHLVLGGAESMLYVSERFEPRQFAEGYVYRLLRPGIPALPRARRESDSGVPSPRQRRAGSRPKSSAPGPARGPVARRRGDGAAATSDTPAELARTGRDAYDGGDHAAAVRAFRKWVYLCPDDALAHFHLGLAFEAAGHRVAAARAFAASRSLLVRADTGESVAAFEGYAIDDILRMIGTKELR